MGLATSWAIFSQAHLVTLVLVLRRTDFSYLTWSQFYKGSGEVVLALIFGQNIIRVKYKIVNVVFGLWPIH
jgi:hypothetical protein